MARSIKLRESLREAMTEEMRRDPLVFLMGEEVAQYNGAYKLSQGMLDEFGPERVIDTPIAELGFAGIGVGAAMNGLRPIIEFMTWNFAVLAFDQIVNNAAKTLTQSAGEFSCPIVFRGPSGSAGQLAQQHSQSFESWLGNCPGLKVISTIDPIDAKALMKAAIRDNDPVCIMESEVYYAMDVELGDDGSRVYKFAGQTVETEGYIPAENEDYVAQIGKAAIRRTGSDVTLVTFNKMIFPSLQAAVELAKEGISVEVIDMMSIRPIDYDTIVNSVKKTNRLVIVDESWPLYGVSSEIAYGVQRYAFDYLDAPIRRVNSADTSLGYAPTFVEEYLPNPTKIIKAIKDIMYVKY
jgi:pyruvate dehydrogenase E1 component beta subunit